MPQTDLILLRPPSAHDLLGLPLLQPPSSEGDSHSPETTSIDILKVAGSFEKAGCRAHIIDLSYRVWSKQFDVNSFIGKLDAPFFAVEISDVEQSPGALEVAQLIKQLSSESRILLFGCASACFHADLISYHEVDFVMRANFDQISAGQFMQAVDSGKFGKIPGLVWKEKRGRVRENEFFAKPVSDNINLPELYSIVMSQVRSYRKFDSASVLTNWLRHPEVSIFKTDCTGSPLIRGNEAMEKPADSPVFRSPEDVYRDIREVCRYSPEPVRVRGDIRSPEKHYAERLLSLLQHKPVANTLIFELSDVTPEFFIQEIARAKPGFRLLITPGSHDEAVRNKLGYAYSNKELESNIAAALKARTGGVEVRFLVGLPGQTAESVTDTAVYCEYLLRRFDGDRRLVLSIVPYLQPADYAHNGSPESYGFKPRFKTFQARRDTLALPGWKDRLEYETAAMSAEQIAVATYDALMRLVRLKAKYGQLPHRKAEEMAAGYKQEMELSGRLEEIASSGNSDELSVLEPEIERINQHRGESRRSKYSLIPARPQNLLAIWKALSNKSVSQSRM